MPYSNYPHGFTDGVAIKNIPVDFAISDKANVFWVDSVHGSDQDKGTFTRPVATIVQALTLCTAGHGDIIYVAAGHTESVISAAGLAFNTAGVTVIFLGEGSARGTISFSTDVLASMVITAANVTLLGPRFVNDINSLAHPFMVLAANCKILNAEYHDGTSKSTIIGILATAVDGFKIDGYKYFQGSGGAAKASHLQLLTLTNAEIRNVEIVGNFSAAPIDMQAATCTNLILENLKLSNTNTGPAPCVVQPSGTTGFYNNIDLMVYSGTTYLSNLGAVVYGANCSGYNAGGTAGDPIGASVSASLEGKVDTINTNVGNPAAHTLTSVVAKLGNGATTVTADLGTLKTNVGDPSGHTLTSITAKLGDGSTTVTADLTTVKASVSKIDGATLAVSPTAGSLATFIASGGTALGTALDASKSIVDAIGSNGTTLAYGSGSILGAIGTTFWIKKTVVSSAITFATPVDITAVSTGGELAIEQVILKTNSVGLATGTNFQLLSDNANGLANICVETVANLGANKTITLDNASVTKIKTVLEAGKKLQVQNTIADGTGAGTVDIYVQFRRLAAGASISVV